jgi:SAM-dependent methyltransferase
VSTGAGRAGEPGALVRHGRRALRPVRPPYPDAAIRWALGPAPLRVVDLGAGTGTLSRSLRRLGYDVVAIEPDDQMRTCLAGRSPDLPALAGCAEQIPLPDRSVDAVVAAQAYHWFDPTRAHPEIALVLRPSGVLVAMWNDINGGEPWARFVTLVDGPFVAFGGRLAPECGAPFEPVARAEFRHAVPMTPDELVALATTRSRYLTAPGPERHRLVRSVRELTAAPPFAGHDRFPVPYLTHVHRATIQHGV